MNRRQVVPRLLEYGRALAGWLAASTVFRILGMGSGITMLAIGAAGVAAVALDSRARVSRFILVMVALALAKGLFRYLEQYTGHYVAFHLLASLRNDFYKRVEPLAPGAFTAKDHSGDLLARAMKDISRIEVFYAHTLAPLVAAIVLPAAAVVFVGVAYHPLFALVLGPAVLLVGFMIPFQSQRTAAHSARDLLESRAELSAHLVDGIQGIREVLSFGYGARRTSELDELGKTAEVARRRLGSVVAVRRGVNELLIGATIAMQLMVGAALVNRGSFSWSELVVALAVTVAVFPSVLAVEEFMGDLEQALGAASRIFETMERQPVVAEAEKAKPPAADSSVVFEDVSFNYPGNGVAPALREVSFTMPAGVTTAVVGPSGAGKSTLLWLLLRFWDPDEGRILLGGEDIRNLSFADLRDRIAVVSQRTHLFNESIAENLRIAKSDATSAEIEEACRVAEIHDFIAGLPNGYETQIGEMGERLSGGQRQRLALARALLKDAPLLVLDEATSELDLETERSIQSQLDALAAGRTTLVIAHRLVTVRNADQILVLDRRRIVERGKHHELLGKSGAYARLWSRQADEATSVKPDRSLSPK